MLYLEQLSLASLRTCARFSAIVNRMLFVARGNILHTMKVKAVGVLGIDVVSAMSMMQQSKCRM